MSVTTTATTTTTITTAATTTTTATTVYERTTENSSAVNATDTHITTTEDTSTITWSSETESPGGGENTTLVIVSASTAAAVVVVILIIVAIVMVMKRKGCRQRRKAPTIEHPQDIDKYISQTRNDVEKGTSNAYESQEMEKISTAEQSELSPTSDEKISHPDGISSPGDDLGYTLHSHQSTDLIQPLPRHDIQEQTEKCRNTYENYEFLKESNSQELQPSYNITSAEIYVNSEPERSMLDRISTSGDNDCGNNTNFCDASSDEIYENSNVAGAESNKIYENSAVILANRGDDKLDHTGDVLDKEIYVNNRILTTNQRTSRRNIVSLSPPELD